MASSPKKIDAFLSHNSRDKPQIEAIANWLMQSEQMEVWLDKWNLIPGNPWQEEIGVALDESACFVMFIGPHNIGPWQHEEMQIAINARVSRRSIRVVPVLLPGSLREEKESELPSFLRNLTWVQFNQSIDEPESRRRLVCGIKNIAPGPTPGEPAQPPITLPALEVCPFRGLEVFGEEDAAFFLGPGGRDTVIT